MMKKIFVLAMASVLTLGAQAQYEMKKMPVTKDEISVPLKHSENVKKTDETDQVYWGYYSGTDFTENVVSIFGGAEDGNYEAAMKVPGNGILVGGKILGVSVPSLAQNMNNLKVWLTDKLESPVVPLVEKDYSGSIASGYTLVSFDNAVDIPDTGLYVGYSFNISKVNDDEDYDDMYPIIVTTVDESKTEGMYLYNNSKSRWDNYGIVYNSALCLKVLVSNVKPVSNYAYFEPKSGQVTIKNETTKIPVKIKSEGSNGVKNIDYSVTVNGNSKSRHLDLKLPVAVGFGQETDDYIEIDAPDEVNPYDAELVIDKVNGVENEAKGIVSTVNLDNLSKYVQRHSVVEENTGTGCGYCPRGLVGMEKLATNFPDKFIGVGLHRFNESDAMYLSDYAQLGFSGAPQCFIDRKVNADPYYGNTLKDTDVITTFKEFNDIPPRVGVDVNAEWNADSTEVTATATIEYLGNSGKFAVDYVLVADGLSGTGKSWLQSNYFYTDDPSSYPKDLALFCAGGEYGQGGENCVVSKGHGYAKNFKFNDVAISSSYDDMGFSTADELTDSPVAGNTVTNKFKLKMPTSESLLSAIDKKKVSVVAIVTDAKKGFVANAAKKLVGYNGSGIESTATNAENKPLQYYSIYGQVLTKPAKGIIIVRMSDGTTHKLLIK
jgi:hypothetical protein